MADRHDDDDNRDIARAILISGEAVAAGLHHIAQAIEDLKPSPADKLVLTYTKRGQ